MLLTKSKRVPVLRFFSLQSRTMTSTFSAPSIRYISPTELSELMKSGKEPMKDYVSYFSWGILRPNSVNRLSSTFGGNIVGCVRAPSSNYLTTVDSLISKTKDVPKMIFHCALSQQRGPKAARVYAETRNNKLNPGETPTQEIYVLRGGFTEFQRLFKVRSLSILAGDSDPNNAIG
ncbi:Rhodanese domain-containing protein [Rhizoctonia solani AG-1 IA]|uniref:Rhodanese domain-containing protein n=1 Tax=Thanatephorus cucumeris (strain AG1-IA) TaxID=983506 RepID=L8WQC0_THACA|nr:Rhodanese domain-containing protein [Rhizoctonia solani AG-1 IA]